MLSCKRMNYDLILKNAAIVTSSGLVNGDIGIKNGKIEKIGVIGGGVKKERDCTGMHILPGAIDMHVHLRDPGMTESEDFATGTAAALRGGITTVIDMPNTDPPTVTVGALEEKRKIARAKSHVNFGFYMGYTGKNLDEIRRAENIAGVKAFLGSSTGNLLLETTHDLEGLFLLGGLTVVHAELERIIREHKKTYSDSEDPSIHSLIRPAQAAVLAVKEVLHCAKKFDARVHITHVSTAQEVEELRKFAGPNVSADVTPHHLFLTQQAYAKLGNFAKVNPPLRTPEDCRALKQALRDNDIQAVASDHAPHLKKAKELEYSASPAGMPGLETMLPLLLDSVNHGEFEIEDVARIIAENPAAILRIKDKGKIEVGYDADLVIIDMELEKKVGASGYATKCGWSAFDGRRIKGWPIETIINGGASSGREIEIMLK